MRFICITTTRHGPNITAVVYRPLDLVIILLFYMTCTYNNIIILFFFFSSCRVRGVLYSSRHYRPVYRTILASRTRQSSNSLCRLQLLYLYDSQFDHPFWNSTTSSLLIPSVQFPTGFSSGTVRKSEFRLHNHLPSTNVSNICSGPGRVPRVLHIFQCSSSPYFSNTFFFPPVQKLSVKRTFLLSITAEIQTVSRRTFFGNGLISLSFFSGDDKPNG